MPVVPIYNYGFRPRAGEHGSLILVGMLVRVSGRAPTEPPESSSDEGFIRAQLLFRSSPVRMRSYLEVYMTV